MCILPTKLYRTKHYRYHHHTEQRISNTDSDINYRVDKLNKKSKKSVSEHLQEEGL
jgi:fatty acid desaturase